ncbi:MAG: tRNA (adenosine(37)-N6)-threonylcarbamoyltransferase complex dimerization subunit type 1 TsaB [Cytophagaceae bacterium]
MSKEVIVIIDTSTSVGSVAVVSKESLLCYIESPTEKSHSKNITHMTEEAMRLAQVGKEDVLAFAVGAGPGSYTGLRIGVTTAKAWCYAWEKPLISVSGLRAMKEMMAHYYPGKVYMPMLDARRMEVYAACWDSEGKMIEKEQAQVLEADTWQGTRAQYSLLCGGDGAEKWKKVLASEDKLEWIPGIYPSTKFMMMEVWEKWEAQKVEDVAYFEPNYIKEFYTTAKKIEE